MSDEFHTFIPWSESEFYEKLETLFPGISRIGTLTVNHNFTTAFRVRNIGSVDWKHLVPIILLQEHNSLKREIDNLIAVSSKDQNLIDFKEKRMSDVWELYLDWYDLFTKHNG